MKKIGFVDYYISEWHANNYPAWIAQACQEKGLDYQVSYVWAEDEVSHVDGVTTAQWCEKYHAEPCATIAELCEKSDYIIVLAPSDPEKHLGYVQEVFKCQKRVYVDKTFAPDAATAGKMIALSKEYGTPFFTTSALRYADGLDALQGADGMSTQGGGRTMDEYIIHQVEMIVRVLGIGAQKVRASLEGEGVKVEVAYDDNRTARMHFNPNIGYACKAVKGGEALFEGPVAGSYFPRLLAKIIHFFETGEVDFSTEQTMEVMRLREAALTARETPGQWVALP